MDRADIHQNDAENTMRANPAVREGHFLRREFRRWRGSGRVTRRTSHARRDSGGDHLRSRRTLLLSTGVFGEEHFSRGAGI